MRRVWLACCLLGCGEDQWPALGPALTVGELTGGSEEDLSHGSFAVQFSRAEGLVDSPYIGTEEVTIAVDYDACFASFYEEHPEYTAESAMAAQVYGTLEDGGEGWFDRLCDPTQVQHVECSVIAFEQILDDVERLRVRYAIVGELENLRIEVGPFPLTTEILDFPCDGVPSLLLSPSEISGRDASGATIWVGKMLDEGMAAPLQEKAVVVKAGPP
jgi:hypothetical protein